MEWVRTVKWEKSGWGRWAWGCGRLYPADTAVPGTGKFRLGDPGLQGLQLLGSVLQEVGDVGLDEAKTAGEGLRAGEEASPRGITPSVTSGQG